MINRDLKQTIEYNFSKIEGALQNKPIPLNIKDENLKEMLEILSTPLVISTPSGIDPEELKALAQPGKVFVREPEVKHLKVKKDIPTVIEYQGRRYILDPKGGNKR